MKHALSILVAVAMLSLSSCSTRVFDCTLYSTKNVDLNRPQGYHVDKSVIVEGKDKGHIICFIPTRNPNIKEATERAMAKAGPKCVALSDVKADSSSWWIPYIYGQTSVTVQGHPVNEN